MDEPALTTLENIFQHMSWKKKTTKVKPYTEKYDNNIIFHISWPLDACEGHTDSNEQHAFMNILSL